MFAEYDYSQAPLIQVTFGKSIQNEEDVNDFLKKWLELYAIKQNFIFLFDTRNMENPPFKYAMRIALFMKQLRKQPIHYLQKSLILVNSDFIRRILDFIFMIQPPIAPVITWTTDEIDKDKIIQVFNTTTKQNLKNKMDYVDPS